jgi:predicted hydrocarbon binding protein
MPILVRREIEVRIAGPLIRAFVKEIGEERAMVVVKRVIRDLARESGAELTKLKGGNSLVHFTKGKSLYSADNAHDKEMLESSDKKLYYNVTRCAYVDMYKELGMEDLGYILSCGRDFEMIKGFNPKMKLVRTKTLMEGDEYCDFRITLE